MTIRAPGRPVLNWHRPGQNAVTPPIDAVFDAPWRLWTTSGRAAIAVALMDAGLRQGATVLLPTYHCPTMISPARHLGLNIEFFPLRENGDPDLNFIESKLRIGQIRVLLLAHYFGFPRPMREVREICDRHGVILIEDCAHALFGTTDGKPIGSWGDYAIGSLTKFLPLSWGGCLVSHRHPIRDHLRSEAPLIQKVKKRLDAIESATCHGRPAGIGPVLHMLFQAKNRFRRAPPQQDALLEPSAPAAADSGLFHLDETTVLTRPSRHVARTTIKADRRAIADRRREAYHATCYRYRAVRQIRDALHRVRQPELASIPADPPRPAPESKNDDSTVRTPFETASWFDLLENTCFARLPGRSVRVSAPCDPDAYFPLWFRSGRMGGYLSGVSNFYTPLFMPTGTTSQKNDAVHGLVRYLRETRGWNTLTLQPVANDAQWLTTLTAELRRVGMLFDFYHCFGNWYTDVSSLDVTSFENALPSRTRHTLARARRRVERDSDFELILESGTVDSDTLQRCIDDFLCVYQRSWKRAEPYPDFIPGLFTLASDKGWLRYACLRYCDEPVASQLWLTHAGVASIYKLAYDERYARYSPGSLLTQTLIRHAIDVDRVEEIDYLVGDDPYKQEWMKSRRVRAGVIVFNRACPGGLVEAARHYGSKNLKKLATKLHPSD